MSARLRLSRRPPGSRGESCRGVYAEPGGVTVSPFVRLQRPPAPVADWRSLPLCSTNTQPRAISAECGHPLFRFELDRFARASP